MESPTIILVQYDENEVDQKKVAKLEDCFPLDKDIISWVHLQGSVADATIECLKDICGIHPLVLEDIVHGDQRPKLEDLEDYLFIVLKDIHYRNGEIHFEESSIILGEKFVFSFLPDGEVSDTIFKRLKRKKSRLRRRGADYLAYSIIDAIVDHYLIVLDRFREKIEELETTMMEEAEENTLQAIYDMKGEVLWLRRTIWPMREMTMSLAKEDSPLIDEKTEMYLRDVHDHILRTMDAVEMSRDAVSGMMDLYLSIMSTRLNDIMRVVTIIGTIFIPLTLIPGIYGMNFLHMPELKWKWGYPFAIFLMAAIASGMLLYFKRKKWI